MQCDIRQTENTIRVVVARLKEADLSSFGLDAKLDLDSIARIALIAELENAFGIEIDAEAVQPEVFETLGSLVALIEAHAA